MKFNEVSVKEYLYSRCMAFCRLFHKPLHERISSEEVWERLLKYKQCLDEVEELNTSAPESSPVKIIWLFWWQGKDNPPPIVARCFESVQRNCGDYKIIILDKNNYSKYVEVPDYVRACFRGREISAHWSDYIRFSLLERYGGVWLDATVFLTDKLPAEILRCDYFQPVSSFWASYVKDDSSEVIIRALDSRVYPENTYLIGDTGILVARKGSKMASTIKRLLDIYWATENEVVTYLFVQYLMTMAVLFDKGCWDEINRMYKWDFSHPRAIQTVLGKTYDAQSWSALKDFSPAHRISYKWSRLIPKNNRTGARTLYGKILDGTIQ